MEFPSRIKSSATFRVSLAEKISSKKMFIYEKNRAYRIKNQLDINGKIITTLPVPSNTWMPRKVGSRIYLYKNSHTTRCFAVITAMKFIFYMPLQTLWTKVVKPIIDSLVLICKKQNVGDFKANQKKEGLNLAMRRCVPLRGLLVFVPMLILSIVSFFSFGSLSVKVNWLIGDLERWSAGVSFIELEEKTYKERLMLSGIDYGAACQQPRYVCREHVKESI